MIYYIFFIYKNCRLIDCFFYLFLTLKKKKYSLISDQFSSSYNVKYRLTIFNV